VTRLIIVRHAEPDAMRGRIYGRLDPPLSPTGRAQAERVALWLQPVPLDAVYASPLRRARETAGFLVRERGIEMAIHPGLVDIDFGEWEGRRFDELERSDPELYRSWMTQPTRTRFPGGENFGELQARVLAAVGEIRRETASAALVAHAGVNRVILGNVLGLADDAIFRLDQPLAAVSVVDWIEDAPIVRAVNLSLESAAWLAPSS
jgi:broad specificity phosphatase PhoE